MNKYSKVVVALVIMIMVAGAGFGTAFGYGSHRVANKPVITAAPVVGKVLGASSMSVNSFVKMLLDLGFFTPERAALMRSIFGL